MPPKFHMYLSYLFLVGAHGLMVLSVAFFEPYIEFQQWYRWLYLFIIPVISMTLMAIGMAQDLVSKRKAVVYVMTVLLCSYLHNCIINEAARIV